MMSLGSRTSSPLVVSKYVVLKLRKISTKKTMSINELRSLKPGDSSSSGPYVIEIGMVIA